MKKFYRIGILTVGLGLNLASICQAQDSNRAGKTELFGVAQFFQGDSQSTSTGPVNLTIDFDDSVMYGIGSGYNFNEYLNLNSELMYGSTDFDFLLNAAAGDEDTDVLQLNLNLEYNILPTRLTPVLTTGIGIMAFNGDIGLFDFSEANVSYSFGGGVRWDIGDLFFFKALYRMVRTELKDFDSEHEFDTFNLYFGIMF